VIEGTSTDASTVAFEHATLVTLLGNAVLSDHTLLVRNRRIESIAPMV